MGSAAAARGGGGVRERNVFAQPVLPCPFVQQMSGAPASTRCRVGGGGGALVTGERGEAIKSTYVDIWAKKVEQSRGARSLILGGMHIGNRSLPRDEQTWCYGGSKANKASPLVFCVEVVLKECGGEGRYLLQQCGGKGRYLLQPSSEKCECSEKLTCVRVPIVCRNNMRAGAFECCGFEGVGTLGGGNTGRWFNPRMGRMRMRPG